MNVEDYPFNVRHLTKDDGGGYLIEFPDLPGCMSDGDNITETIANGFDAAQCWIAAAKQSGRKIPSPGNNTSQSGKWVQRVPKSIHARLAMQAKNEGVSLNSLVLSMVSEKLGTVDESIISQHAGQQYSGDQTSGISTPH